MRVHPILPVCMQSQKRKRPVMELDECVVEMPAECYLTTYKHIHDALLDQHKIKHVLNSV